MRNKEMERRQKSSDGIQMEKEGTKKEKNNSLLSTCQENYMYV
jgi:hypothetical protein